jgi:hypothetical protein
MGRIHESVATLDADKRLGYIRRDGRGLGADQRPGCDMQLK